MATWLSWDEMDEGAWRVLKYAGLALLGTAAAAGIGALLARDQMQRHKRELFSPHPLRRLAALGYIRGRADINNVLLLRDFLAWEERPLLRKRAASILESMEQELTTTADRAEGA